MGTAAVDVERSDRRLKLPGGMSLGHGNNGYGATGSGRSIGSGGAWRAGIALGCGIAIAAAASAGATSSGGTASTAGTAGTAFDIGGVIRLRNVVGVHEDDAGAIAANAALTAGTSVAAATAATAIGGILATAAAASRPPSAAGSPSATGSAVAACPTVPVNPDTGEELGHLNREVGSVAASHSVGTGRAVGSRTARTTTGGSVVAVPVANRVLALGAGGTGTAGRSCHSAGTRGAARYDIEVASWHGLSPFDQFPLTPAQSILTIDALATIFPVF